MSNRGTNRGRGSRVQQGQAVTSTKVNRGTVKFIASQTITRGGRGAKRSARGRTLSPNKKVQAPVVAQRSPSTGKSPRGNLKGARRGGKPPTSNPAVSPGKRGGRGGRGGDRGRGRGLQRGGSGGGRGGQTSQRGRSPGRGRGRGRGGNTKVSKEDLDKQLDQYMSKTRGALDQDLENYMSKMNDVEMS